MEGGDAARRGFVMPVSIPGLQRGYSFPPPLNYLAPLVYGKFSTIGHGPPHMNQEPPRMVGAHSLFPRVIARYATVNEPSGGLKRLLVRESNAERHASGDRSVTLWFPRRLRDVFIFEGAAPEAATISEAFVCFSEPATERDLGENSIKVLYHMRKLPGQKAAMDYSIDYSSVEEPVKGIVEAVLESKGMLGVAARQEEHRTGGELAEA